MKTTINRRPANPAPKINLSFYLTSENKVSTFALPNTGKQLTNKLNPLPVSRLRIKQSPNTLKNKFGKTLDTTPTNVVPLQSQIENNETH
jgi:hypothetical protein